MNLNKYYTRTVMIPFIVLLTGHILYTIWDLAWGPGKDYTSEWMTAGAAHQLSIFIVIVHGLLFAIMAADTTKQAKSIQGKFFVELSIVVYDTGKLAGLSTHFRIVR